MVTAPLFLSGLWVLKDLQVSREADRYLLFILKPRGFIPTVVTKIVTKVID